MSLLIQIDKGFAAFCLWFLINFDALNLVFVPYAIDSWFMKRRFYRRWEEYF